MAAKRAFLILTLERTGSNLLSSALNRVGRTGRVGEWFNPTWMHDHALRVGAATEESTAAEPALRSLAAYVDALAEHHSNDGSFGAKVHRPHYEYLERHGWAKSPLDLVPASARGDARIVVLTREDRRRQAISTLRAHRSGVYAVLTTGERRGMQFADATAPDVTGPLTPEVLAALDGALARIVQQEDGWRRWAEASGERAMWVTYEDLSRDYRATVVRTLRFVGDVEIGRSDVPLPLIHVQRDSTTERILQAWAGGVAG